MELIAVDHGIRLRPFHSSDIDSALAWYADPVVLNGTISPGRTEPCSREMLEAMYDDLSYDSDLFIIEVLENSMWIAIGDVTLAKDCMPIVIGNSKYRGRGLSKQIPQRLLILAKEKGYSEINLKEIYDNNIPSIKLFEEVGFKKTTQTKNGFSYRIIL